MAVMHIDDYQAELTRAGAETEGRGGTVFFLASRHPLGAIGTVIMTLFVLAPLTFAFGALVTETHTLLLAMAVIGHALRRRTRCGGRCAPPERGPSPSWS